MRLFYGPDICSSPEFQRAHNNTNRTGASLIRRQSRNWSPHRRTSNLGSSRSRKGYSFSLNDRDMHQGI